MIKKGLKIYRNSLLLFLIFSLNTYYSFAQRYSSGIVFQVGNFNILKINQDIISSKHSYRMYYNDDKYQTNIKMGFSFGFSNKVDFRRFMLSQEFIVFTGIASYSVKYPIAKNEYIDYNSEITYGGINLPLSISYTFASSSKYRLYLESGGSYFILLNAYETNESSWDKDVMNDYLYDDENYFNILFGLGFHSSTIGFGIRFNKRLGEINGMKNSILLLTPYIYSRENFSKLQKHHIYVN